MLKNDFPGGEWPTMLTPFRDGAVDYPALEELVVEENPGRRTWVWSPSSGAYPISH